MDFIFHNPNFQILDMILGLCLFLFGMNLMGEALERRAGGALRTLLGKLTTNKMAGFLTGLGVTAVIQSSSATTVMVVGFVNSGLMNLKQAINVILGANVGTTVTAWILSLSGIEGSGILELFKPSSFTPILALVGIIMYMFLKGDKKKDTGLILLGFATLMFGMDTMSGAVKGLANVPEFTQIFTMFENPILGLLAGAILTAIIQSSSASVGILQALAATGSVSYGATIPIIMGQNIGTCVTAMISSVGATKNAKRAAFVHLIFNVLGSILLLILFAIIKAIFSPLLLTLPATEFGIAVAHSLFNVACVIIFLPLSSLLEKIAIMLIPDAKKPEVISELDDRLLQTPQLALERCRVLVMEMADAANTAMMGALECLEEYNPDTAQKVRVAEDLTDHYEDILGTYLVKLGSHRIGEENSAEATELHKLIGDIERIADHSVNVLESAEELNEKGLEFSAPARAELATMTGAVREILRLTMSGISTGDLAVSAKVEPLEQIVDDLKEELRTRHIMRLNRGNCSIEAGFVWSDLLTNLERVSDHCSNISACIIDTAHHNLNLHESTRSVHENDTFYAEQLKIYREQYKLS
ncbi:MAG: Na/Pi cotransporter family protein [Clostridia bacterium]|nr:Na/Pi cotransporter family protein [Clostridia bacterium]